jgi:predicted metal-dependent peptidase
MKPDDISQKHISALLMRICQRNTFFASLTLQAKLEISHEVPTAATDGERIFVNPDFFSHMTILEQEGVLLHEVLHAALLHVQRRGGRDPKVWNIAADIVVNGIITDEGYVLPKDAVLDANLKRFGVEEVYDKLLDGAEVVQISVVGVGDLLDGAPGDAEADTGGEGQNPKDKQKSGDAKAAVWKGALEQAKHLARSTGQGSVPRGVAREMEQLQSAQIDWRTQLWRFMVQSPSDFGGYDRRFISDGLYLEVLEALKVKVCVAIDTSGSINQHELTLLASEVREICNSYPDIDVTLYFADAEVYGPYELQADSPIPEPQGGGGTDFRPFFSTLDATLRPRDFTIAVYLTDGWGTFPDQAPIVPTLWVVTPGGRALEDFPFGDVVRMIKSA